MTNPLSPDEVNALQGRELDAAVAEWMGCTVTRDRHGNYQCGCGQTCDYPHSPVDADSQLYGPLNCYSTDISAIYEVEEEIQKRNLTEQYIEALSQIISSQSHTTVDFLWRMTHATPEQRARAVVLMAQEIAAQDRLMHQMSDHAMGVRGEE